MRFEAFSTPKARDLSVPPDDVPLHIPGRVTAVFDGASDALRRKIDGLPIGRVAAMSAAQATASLPPEAIDWSVEKIFGILSEAIADVVSPDTEGGPASTTATIAFETNDSIRLIGLGDTGFRINGGAIENVDLAPDAVSISARVALFEHFAKLYGFEEAEAHSQHVIGLGLQAAKDENIISPDFADEIVGMAIKASAISGADEDIAHYLFGGLQHQHLIANNPDHPLGYGILNGRKPICSDAIDKVVSKDGLTTLELFSDGYLDYPDGTTLGDWEAIHAELEKEDPHHIHRIPAVKGSTATKFFDDRTIAILSQT